MSLTYGKCINFGPPPCKNYINKEIVTIPEGSDFICPECEAELLQVPSPESGKGGNFFTKRNMLIGGIAVLVVLLSFGIWYYIGHHKTDPQKDKNKGTDTTKRDVPFHSPEGKQDSAAKSDVKPKDGTLKQLQTPLVATGPKPGYVDDEGLVKASEFKKRILEKMGDLNRYLNVVANNEKTPVEKRASINNAVTLFVSESSTVQVSSINSDSSAAYPIRTYLNRMMYLKYDAVKITFSKFQYVSKFYKGKDGNLWGHISFEQTFTGYNGKEITYRDRSRKNQEVMLKLYTTNENGVRKTEWELFLSDIGVSVTN